MTCIKVLCFPLFSWAVCIFFSTNKVFTGFQGIVKVKNILVLSKRQIHCPHNEVSLLISLGSIGYLRSSDLPWEFNWGHTHNGLYLSRSLFQKCRFSLNSFHSLKGNSQYRKVSDKWEILNTNFSNIDSQLYSRLHFFSNALKYDSLI